MIFLYFSLHWSHLRTSPAHSFIHSQPNSCTAMEFLLHQHTESSDSPSAQDLVQQDMPESCLLLRCQSLQCLEGTALGLELGKTFPKNELSFGWLVLFHFNFWLHNWWKTPAWSRIQFAEAVEDHAQVQHLQEYRELQPPGHSGPTLILL